MPALIAHHASSRGLRAVWPVLPALLLQACASHEEPALQTVRVQTPGCAAARCELSNDRGHWTLARTPGSVAVGVSGTPLRVSCHADDVRSAEARVTVSRPGASGGGAVAGGVVGGTAVGVALGGTALAFIPPLGVVAVLAGAGVGATAGHVAESRSRPWRYPTLISLPMNCAAGDGAAPGGASAPRPLGLTVRGLTRAESLAAGLGERTAVQVLSVAADGPAALAGLREGDVLLALDGHQLGDAADLEEQVAALPPHAPLALRVWRGQRVLELVLKRALQEARP